jgi:hypothetical protein
VDVRDRQQIRDTRRDPLVERRPLVLGTVAIAAGIMGDACQATVVAGIDVTAESRRPASFDRPHDATFATAKVTGVLSSVGRPMPPQDVGDFEGRAQLPARSRLLPHLPDGKPAGLLAFMGRL